MPDSRIVTKASIPIQAVVSQDMLILGLASGSASAPAACLRFLPTISTVV